LIKVKPENSAVCVPPTGLVQPHGKHSKLWARLDWGARDERHSGQTPFSCEDPRLPLWERL